jgi:hypothetical protein
LKPIFVLEEVWQDAAESAEWYDTIEGKELGDRFISTFYSYWSQIQRDDEAPRLIYKQFRRVLIEPFPYALYYKVMSNRIVLALLWHTARRPRHLRELLQARDKVKL